MHAHIALFAALLPGMLAAQDLVDQAPRLRNVLLEEYAAVNCGNCPAAHDLAQDIQAMHPGRVTSVEVHGGALANPTAGQPDFRNEWATALWSHYGLVSQPKGTVDRIPRSGQVVLGTGDWMDAVHDALALPSRVNVGMASSFDVASRQLSVRVQLYYTGDGPVEGDRLCVLLKEDHITGYQQDYVNGPHADYDHLNVLRAYISDLWGDAITPTTAGTLLERTYTYTLPEAWNAANCAVVAFVGAYQGEIQQVSTVAADGGTTTGVNTSERYTALAPAFPVPADERISLPLPAATGELWLRVSDAAGRTVLDQVVRAQHVLSLGTSAFAPGAYTYTFHGPEGRWAGRFTIAR